jgi:hypothetical protein
MPRSGTTLVEQIVSSHPQVFGTGELNNFLDIEQNIANQLKSSESYPDCIHLLDESTANKLINDYLSCLLNYASDAKYVTDKLPGNFLRIGLIKTLFPKARIIHCHRNSLDTCLSVYCNYFTGEHNYAYDLEELGAYYIQYERLMKHWHNIFSSQILDVQYEELVMDQENISRQIIDYLELTWDNVCLEFYKNQRPVQTASNVQIRRPMYLNSINRWKHFELHLQPLKEILAKASAQ